MDILFLDDDASRADQFDRRTGLKVHRVLTRGEFESAVLSQSWDLICLDHDLGWEQDNQKWDGCAAARWLADNRSWVRDNQRVIIHSLNMVGVSNMIAAMKVCDHLEVDYIRNLWSRVSYTSSRGLSID